MPRAEARVRELLFPRSKSAVGGQGGGRRGSKVFSARPLPSFRASLTPENRETTFAGPAPNAPPPTPFFFPPPLAPGAPPSCACPYVRRPLLFALWPLRFPGARLLSAGLGSPWQGSTGLGSAPLGSSSLRPVRLGSSPLGFLLARLGSARLDSARLRLGARRLKKPGLLDRPLPLSPSGCRSCARRPGLGAQRPG